MHFIVYKLSIFILIPMHGSLNHNDGLIEVFMSHGSSLFPPSPFPLEESYI